VSPRPEHVAWHNTVLPADDPWWDTHYPPNGWGCKCGVVSLSERQVERLVERAKNTAHPVKRSAPPAEYYEWTDKAGKTHRIPKGIDPGWDYNVGKTAWGQRLSDDVMAQWKAQGRAVWEPLTEGDYVSAGRPEKVPADPTRARPIPRVSTTAEAAAALKKIFGGDTAVFSFSSKKFRYDVLASASALAQHVDLDRSMFFPFIPEAVEAPYEIWASFEKHKGTGQVVLRLRFIKVVRMDKARAAFVVANARGGFMEAYTFIPTSDLKYLNRQRRGKLIYGR